MCLCGVGIGVWLCGRGVLAPGLCFCYVRSVLWRGGDFRKEVAVAAIGVNSHWEQSNIFTSSGLALSPCQMFGVQGRPCSSPESYEKQTQTLEMLETHSQPSSCLICTGDLNSTFPVSGGHVSAGMSEKEAWELSC